MTSRGPARGVHSNKGSFLGSDFGNGVVLVKLFWPCDLFRRSGDSNFVAACPAVGCGLTASIPGYTLRSVVSAVAANMMLVRCNSGVPISHSCSPVEAATVRATASPEPRPSGHSETRARSGGGWYGCRVRPLVTWRPAGMSLRRATCDGARQRSGGPRPPSRAYCRGASRSAPPMFSAMTRARGGA